jgi:hypothetical protein
MTPPVSDHAPATYSDGALLNAIRDTMDVTGWDRPEELVIDKTVARLLPHDADDETRDTLRGRLQRVWVQHFGRFWSVG